MTQQRDNHEENLRRALRSAVDSIEPSEDGLERIRARLTTPYPLPIAWVMGAYSEVARRARGWLQSIAVWLQTVLAPRLEPRQLALPSTPAGRRRMAQAGLAAALVAATLALAAGTSVLTPLLRHTFSLTSSLAHTIEGNGPAGTGKQGVSDHDSGQPPGAGAAAGTAHGTQGSGEPGAANCATRTPAQAARSTNSSTPATSPSPADTSPSPADTSPSPADTSPSPADTSPSPADTSPSPADTSPSPSASPGLPASSSPGPCGNPAASPGGVISPGPATSTTPATSPGPATSPSGVTSPGPATSPSGVTSPGPATSPSEVTGPAPAANPVPSAGPGSR